MRTSVLESGAPREGALFVQTEIPAGTSFQGSIASIDESAAELVKKFNGSTDAYLGRRRSGKAQIDFSISQIPQETPQLYEWSGVGTHWAAMTFTSDVILLDRLLRPITNLNDKSVSEYFALPSGVKVVVKNAFVQCRKVAGWSGIGQMFKPDDIAMRAGSTFLLYFEAGEENAILQWMKDIVEHGIGLRYEEGFGRVTFSEPLHMATLKNQKAGQAL
jgi:CRISPR-associated protein Csx10